MTWVAATATGAGRCGSAGPLRGQGPGPADRGTVEPDHATAASHGPRTPIAAVGCARHRATGVRCARSRRRGWVPDGEEAEEPYDERDGVRLSRTRVVKAFRGEIEGESTA